MIEYIEINGTKHPVRINRKALIKFEKLSGKGIESLGNLDTDGLSQLLYMGIEEGYKFENKNIPYVNYESYEDDLDSMDILSFYDDVAKVITNFFYQKEKEVNSTFSSHKESDTIDDNNSDGIELAIEAGLTPLEYYDLTPIEFYHLQNGYTQRIRNDYNIARFIGYFCLRPHLDKANSNKSIEELIKFHWDKKNLKKELKPITLEEFEIMKEKFKI